MRLTRPFGNQQSHSGYRVRITKLSFSQFSGPHTAIRSVHRILPPLPRSTDVPRLATRGIALRISVWSRRTRRTMRGIQSSRAGPPPAESSLLRGRRWLPNDPAVWYGPVDKMSSDRYWKIRTSIHEPRACRPYKSEQRRIVEVGRPLERPLSKAVGQGTENQTGLLSTSPVA